MAENRVIGRDGRLPWHLPADMRRFKRLTTGHSIVMGRKTWESLDAPLPDRRTIVLTRDPELRPAGVEVVPDLDTAWSITAGEDEVFVVGGQEIYAAALPRADRIYLTVVHAAIDGDTRFPPLDMDQWDLVEDVRHVADDRHAHPFSFRLYHRRRRPSMMSDERRPHRHTTR